MGQLYFQLLFLRFIHCKIINSLLLFNKTEPNSHKGGFMIKELCFKRQELQIYGKIYLPGDGTGVYPTVIFGHGFGSNHTFKKNYAQMFADAGIACYIFDFCGGGRESKSDGEMLQMSVETEKEDMAAVLDGMLTQDFVDKRYVYLMGASQGGFVAATLAPERQNQIRGLILLYPAFIIPDDARKRFPRGTEVPESYSVMGNRIGRRYQEDAERLEIYEIIREYTGNVLIIHGDCDEIVPLSYSERAKEVYHHAQLITLQGAGHGFSGADEQTAGKEAVLFVQRYSKSSHGASEEVEVAQSEEILMDVTRDLENLKIVMEHAKEYIKKR
ncbi:MAG: alpha/beta fold hydrolase [Lachnospiraceae bacterium]|nr:alpha/beta fold hydrolase [Lachnospiraceae bacterium]